MALRGAPLAAHAKQSGAMKKKKGRKPAATISWTDVTPLDPKDLLMGSEGGGTIMTRRHPLSLVFYPHSDRARPKRLF